jgi:muramoyltetrapeptide carboxypeptidase
MKPSQTLRIVAPSGAMETPDLLPTAAQRLSKLGFTVELDAQCHLIQQRFAGEDMVRAQALETAILDHKVNIVMAARGGYGAHRLLPMLDWSRLAKVVKLQGTMLVGHSDFTAIQLALLRHGAPSWAGPCAGVDFGGERVDAFMKREFLNASRGTFELNVKAKQAHALTANGMLWGGNLAMLCSLLGTPYFPKTAQIAGGILFLEDTNERPFRVERMLNQLHMAGVLGSQSAVLWGGFGKPVEAPTDRGYGLNSVLKYLRDALKVPVVTGLPFGHTAKKATLPVGQHVKLTATLSGFNLELSL